ncbi:MAG TPA: hypothetical protein VNO30_23120 [Kofleriaceae bacterium]|nr:hypothetical protein [Kofleriaceae bacterium]
MSVRQYEHYDQPFLKGTSWDVNGEFLLLEKEAPAESLLTISGVRKREWLPRIYASLEDVAKELGVYRRIETGIDCHFVVIDPDGRDALLAAISRYRMSDVDYERLDREGAHVAVIERIEQLGEAADWSQIDEDLVAERFPLGYRARTAIEDLQARGALRVVPRKGEPPRLVVTEVGRAIVTSSPALASKKPGL